MSEEWTGFKGRDEQSEGGVQGLKSSWTVISTGSLSERRVKKTHNGEYMRMYQ